MNKKTKRWDARKIVIYFLTFCLVSNTWLPAVLATPAGGAFTVGTGTIEYGANTAVTVDQAQSIIEWGAPGTGGIDTASGEFLTFLQAEGLSNSAVLNRIMSGNPTQFDGTLNGLDMQIFVVNPAGIIFGEGSHVNVAQLVASSLDIADQDFLDGHYAFSASGDYLGSVINNGEITTEQGAALIGKAVLNAGTISTDPDGFVVMAAGDRVLLGEPGSKIIVEMDSVTVPEGAEGIGDVINEGEIESPGGTIVLAAGDIFSAALDPDPVRVESGIGRVVQDGDISADGIDGDGGSVTLTAGDEVILAGGSQTTANGGVSNAGANGGEVVAYASELYVHTATVDFQAGAVIEVMGGSPEDPTVLAPEDTVEKFDGGLAEISGNHLFFDGTVYATSESFNVPDPLDPWGVITITPEGGTLHIDPVTLTLADGPIPVDGAAEDTFYEEVLETYSQTGVNTLLEGDFAITVENISDGEITGGTGDIALRTAYNTGGIEFLPATEGDPITTSIATTAGDIYMLAGAGGIATGDLSTSENGGNPGTIRLFTNNGGSIETGAMDVDGGNEVEVSVIASGDLTINGGVVTRTNKVPDDNQTGEAKMCLVSENGAIDIDGAVEVESHGKNHTSATIHICAEETVTIDTGNGRVEATANTSGNDPADTADAQIRIHAGQLGGISVIRSAGGSPVRGSAKTGGSSIGPIDSSGAVGDNYEETDEGSYLLIEIADAWLDECPDCPKPPVIPPPVEPDPIALPDFDDTHMGDAVTGNVLTNDDASLAVESYTQPGHGTVEVDAEGNYTYTPDEGYVGEDSFTYTATDGDFTTEPITVTITMTNTPPVLGEDIVTVDFGTSVVIDVLINDSDPENDLFTIEGFTYEGAGNLVQNGDGTFTYTPAEGFSGQESFTYSATDGEIGAEPVQTTVTITVRPQVQVAAPPSPVAPGLEPVEIETSGCPALTAWAAAELGIDEGRLQIGIANALASGMAIQACDACAGLKQAATILQDSEGTHIAALAQVINEFASSTAPPTEEQMTSIANAMAQNVGAENQYATAGQYIDALARYVGILNGELGFSAEDAIQLATDNYIGPLAAGQDVGVAAYVAARLVALGGS
ncbi:MAG: cadherin-like domain-containing protein [Phycisphaerales bacterium]|nr:MAG: cadherin-like domain-containing protein [Phycisphaerales bacterium]